MSSVFVLMRILWRYRYSNIFIFELFLLLNPYVLLLHVSLLRDDLILSLVILVASIFYVFQNIKTIKIHYLSGLLVLIFLLLQIRFGFGIICFSLAIYIIIERLWFLRGIYKLISITFLFIILYQTINGLFPEMDVNKFAANLRKLLFSPLPHNVLTGVNADIGADTSLLPVYSLIFPLFAIAVTIRIALSTIYNLSFISIILRRHVYVFLLSIGLLLPFAFSSLEVAGPRQSLSATVLLFFIFGSRYLNITWLLNGNRPEEPKV